MPRARRTTSRESLKNFAKKGSHSDTSDDELVEEDVGVPKWLPKSVADFVYVTLWEPVSAASLVGFRIMWGLVMFYECLTYMFYDWAKLEYILALKTRFKYWGFEWINPWPGIGMHIHVTVMAVLALCITFGFQFRKAAILYFFMFAFLFLQEMTLYLNHFYLVCILCFLFACTDMSPCFSIDTWLNPRKKRTTVEYWNLFAYRFLITIVYFYAGVAKINEDWLRAEPLLHWLPKRAHYRIIGPLVAMPLTAWVFSYGGLFLDLFIGPALWWKKTRFYAVPFVVFFHSMNKLIFNIGIFPWMMLASTTIYFEPDWPLTLYASIFEKKVQQTSSPVRRRRRLDRRKIIVLVFLTIFFVYQIWMPLRHWTYPGDVTWTEEGHRWSWRMKLRDKKADARFFITDPRTSETFEVNQNHFLTRKQQTKISCRPELIILFAHELAKRYNETNHVRPKVTAEVICSVNYRTPQHMVKPGYDLANDARPWEWPNEWVIPLNPLGEINQWSVPDWKGGKHSD